MCATAITLPRQCFDANMRSSIGDLRTSYFLDDDGSEDIRVDGVLYRSAGTDWAEHSNYSELLGWRYVSDTGLTAYISNE